ncbi:MAG: hypothetical protein JWQ96_537 [Segetibacter sp.]|nr:hypothetical protein [Segetibacter sp.]
MKLIFVAFLLSSFIVPGDESFKSLSALQGLWKMETRQGAIYEEWRKVNGQLLKGRSYKINGTDTVVTEQVDLKKDKDNLFYIVSVPNQNKEKPVSFTLVSSNTKRFVFENKKHDFPQRIIYSFVSSDSIVARIEGTVEGKAESADFYFKRIK